jgi:acetyl esterase/lipase
LALKPQLRQLLSILQIIAGFIVLLFSFVAIVPLPTISGAILNMIIIEGKPYLLFIAIILMFIPFSKGWKRWVFPLISFTILSIAPISSYFVINDLPQLMNQSFGKEFHTTSNFSFPKYFLGESFITINSIGIAKDTNGTTIDFDAYFPEKKSVKNALVILIHGGGFTSGDKYQMRPLGQWLAEHDINAVSLNYSLAPESKFPTQCKEVIAAIDYCRNKFKNEINIDKVYLVGASAGATIALNTVGYLKNQTDSTSIKTLNAIKGVVNLYGITDTQLELSARFKSIYDLNKMVNQYTGIEANNLRMVPAIACPLLNKGFCNKPVISIHGSKDNIVPSEHARLLHLILSQKNIPNLYIELPWATHSFEHPLSGPSGQVVRNTIEMFVKN